jgi:hypothetical protein
VSGLIHGTALRDHYALEAVPLIERMLQLLDRDPTSPTYGCFDRGYWHYRVLDFPSGMIQECVLPLALAYLHPFPGNRLQGEPRLVEWVRAGIDFARRSGHRDGSCDDYYPFERALGAATFSLAAMARSARILGIRDGTLLRFLVRRARWIASHGESGVLSNHHAIAALALAETGRLAGDPELLAAAARKAAEVRRHQHEEGWHLEYEGFDPGYETITVDYLARYWKLTGDDSVLPGLERAVGLLETVQHPDGTFGGEYGARNTHHVHPHGFELLAPVVPAAQRIADRVLRAVAAGRRARNDDDRLLAHAAHPFLEAWLDFAPRPGPTPREPPSGRRHLPGAGFLVDRRPGFYLIAGLAKGGTFRAYASDRLVANDSGPALELEDGSLLVTHLGHDARCEVSESLAVSRGPFRHARSELMTPLRIVVLRLLMLVLGRFARDLIRRRLQRRLILARKDAPFRHTRHFETCAQGVRVRDEIEALPGSPRLRRGWWTTGRTSVYVAAGQPWEQGWLLPPAPIPGLDALAAGRTVVAERLVAPPRDPESPAS